MTTRRPAHSRSSLSPASLGLLAVLAIGCGEQRVEFFGDREAGIVDGAVDSGMDAAPDGAIEAGPEAGLDAGLDAGDLALRNPEACGSERVHCEDWEYCIDGTCVCRPGLAPDGTSCFDPDADGDRCGPGAVNCPSSCEDGACVATCSPARTACGTGCVDSDTDPLHCGFCNNPCGANQLCVGGLCQVFRPVARCDECANTCCAYPARPADLVCVVGGSC